MVGLIKGLTSSALVALAILGSVPGSSAINVKALQSRWEPPPVPGCTPYTPFKYLGCYIEENPTTLVYNTQITFETMTVDICIAACKSNGYKYAGLEYYGKCYCGNVLSTPTLLSECDAPCKGDPTQICGGVTARLSIYEDTTFPAVDTSPAALVASYVPQGCYTETGTDFRAVTWRQSQLDYGALTVEMCLLACGQASFPYAAVEWYGECYCGTMLLSGSVPAPSGECSAACNGNPSEFCGGSDRLNLYYSSQFKSTQPCGYTPPPPPGGCTGTGFGYIPGHSTTFISLGISTRWGWVLTGSLPLSGNIYVGAGQNDLTKGSIAGTFTIAKVGTNVVLTYNLGAGYTLTESHFYYGTGPPSKSAPGTYGNTHTFTTGVSTDSFTVPYSATKDSYVVHAAITGSGSATCGAE